MPEDQSSLVYHLPPDDPIYDMLLGMVKSASDSLSDDVMRQLPEMLRRMADRLELELRVKNAETVQ